MSFKRIGKKWFLCDDADMTETQRIQAQVQQQADAEFRRRTEQHMRDMENLQAQAQEHIQEASRINEFNRQMMNDAQLLHIFGPPNF